MHYLKKGLLHVVLLFFMFSAKTQVPVKWTMPEAMRAAINNTKSNIKNMSATLVELDKMLDSDKSTTGARINNTKSNVKNLTASFTELEYVLENFEMMEKNTAVSELINKMAAMNTQFLALQESLNKAGRQYSTVSNVLKTKHDTVKNSIGNIR